MKETKKLLLDHLEKARVMQLATSVNNHPWVCTVHFYVDADFNFYWISTPARRHSEEIKQNPHVSATIKIHEDTPTESYVIGITVEGTAKLLTADETKKVGKHYFSKLKKDPMLLDDILTGKNPHKFYRLTPSNIVLFDSKNFPDNPRQEYTIT